MGELSPAKVAIPPRRTHASRVEHASSYHGPPDRASDLWTSTTSFLEIRRRRHGPEAPWYIVHLQWKLKRLPRMEMSAVDDLVHQAGSGKVEDAASVMKDDLAANRWNAKSTIERLQMYEMRLERSLRAAWKDLRELRKEAEENPQEEELVPSADASGERSDAPEDGAVERDEAPEDELNKRTQFACNERPEQELGSARSESEPAVESDPHLALSRSTGRGAMGTP